MGRPNKKQHFCPAFYIAGFTGSGTEFVQCLRKQTGAWARAKPRAVGHQRDFYAVDAEGVDPLLFEKALADDIEGPASTAIASVVAEPVPPRGETLDALLAFVAVMAVRGPAMREMLDKATDELSRLTLSNVSQFAQPEEALAARAALQALDDGCTVGLAQNQHVASLIDGSQAILPELHRRTWSLWRAPSEDLPFITSDAPVFCGPVRHPMHPPGFENATEITVPLTKSLALLGFLDGAAESVEVPREKVAALNARSVRSATRLVVAPHLGFDWSPDRALLPAAALAEMFGRKR